MVERASPRDDESRRRTFFRRLAITTRNLLGLSASITAAALLLGSCSTGGPGRSSPPAGETQLPAPTPGEGSPCPTGDASPPCAALTPTRSLATTLPSATLHLPSTATPAAATPTPLPPQALDALQQLAAEKGWILVGPCELQIPGSPGFRAGTQCYFNASLLPGGALRIAVANVASQATHIVIITRTNGGGYAVAGATPVLTPASGH